MFYNKKKIRNLLNDLILFKKNTETIKIYQN